MKNKLIVLKNLLLCGPDKRPLGRICPAGRTLPTLYQILLHFKVEYVLFEWPRTHVQICIYRLCFLGSATTLSQSSSLCLPSDSR